MHNRFLLKVVMLSLLFAFFSAYLLEKTGYYEYHLQQKKTLTEKEIQKFEKDIEEGNKIDLEDYLSQTNVDYSNSLTKTTSTISLKMNQYLKTFLKDGVRVVERFVK